MQKYKSYEVIKQAINENKLLLAYVKSNKCPVCDVILPKIETIAINQGINSAIITIEDVPEFSGQHSVFTAPTVILFVSGKEVFRKSRFIIDQELEEEIIKWKMSELYNL